jgi:hypothetical protein
MKLATIVANAEKKISGEALVFVAEPSSEQERLAGKLFAIIEIEARKNDAKSVASFIVERANINYYENEKLSLRDRIEDLKIENIFETVLVKTNSDLVDFLISKKISIRPQDVNITIGVIFQDQIHFSNTGKNKPMLLHRENDGTYKMISIKCDEHKNDNDYNLKKIFSSIISGVIPAKSYFIFANESLSEYLFNKEIINIISKLAPAGAAEQAKNTLLNLNLQAPFLGIIIKNNYGEVDYEVEEKKSNQISAEPKIAPAIPYVNEADKKPKNIEKETAAILSSGGIINTEKIKEGISNIIKDNKIINSISSTSQKIIENVNRPKAENTTPTTINKEFLNDNSSRQKLFKVVGIILVLAVVVFAGSLLFKQKAKDQVATAVRVKSAKETIEQKENQIDSYLLYKNEKEAGGVLSDLKTIINGLSASDIKNIDNYQQLLDKYQSQSDEINHVVKVIPLNLKTTINFSDISTDAIIDNISIIDDSGVKKIYASANNKKTIYERNLNNNNNGLITSDKIKTSNNYPLISGSTIYYLDQNQITKLNTKNDQLDFNAVNLPADKNPIGISIYNDKLYMFEKTGRNLLKFSLLNGVYDKPETRLSLGIDNMDISSFAINLNEGPTKSYVLLLKSNGVLKYLDGKQQNFSLAAVTPALSAATEIKVFKNIYIMEPQNKRVIEFDKTGKLVKQFQSDQLDNLKDFTVDENTNTLYFLNGTSVLETSLN